MHCPVAWKTVCLSKDKGGLQLRDISTWNKALLAKTLWNIHTKNDSLRIQWIHIKYLSESTIQEFLSHICLTHLLKNILTLRDHILQDCSGDYHSAAELLEKWFGTKGMGAAYHHLREKCEMQLQHKAIWKNYIPPKFSITMQLAIRGRLKTVDRL